MKPKSASEILRQNSPRKTFGAGQFAGNRLSAFRAASPANSTRSSVSSFRDRSVSVSSKRKLDYTASGPSYADVTGSNPLKAFSGPSKESLAWAENMHTQLAQVKSLCDKTFQAIETEDISPALANILGDITTALSKSCDIQAELSGALGIQFGSASRQTETHQSNGYAVLGAVPKKARMEYNRVNLTSNQVKTTKPSLPEGPPVDPTISNFRTKVKEAEKCTLLFNLDLGKVPVMNQNTISSKVTAALTTMAASTEGKTSSIPSEDAIAAIDDVLSVVKGMDFFGKTT